ncbi:hypothetical protein [Nocardia sp. NPDC051570]|uniref:hypothetical protein n=1 Tax=Nocardia sp. NPDC051570 TaxID=3364324 RepID=UPI00378DC88C
MDDETSVDELILTEKIGRAPLGIRAELGCSIHEAIDEFQRRYDRLRTDRPD